MHGVLRRRGDVCRVTDGLAQLHVVGGHVAFDVEFGVGLVQGPRLVGLSALQYGLDWCGVWFGFGTAWVAGAVGILDGVSECV